MKIKNNALYLSFYWLSCSSDLIPIQKLLEKSGCTAGECFQLVKDLIGKKMANLSQNTLKVTATKQEILQLVREQVDLTKTFSLLKLHKINSNLNEQCFQILQYVYENFGCTKSNLEKELNITNTYLSFSYLKKSELIVEIGGYLFCTLKEKDFNTTKRFLIAEGIISEPQKPTEKTGEEVEATCIFKFKSLQIETKVNLNDTPRQALVCYFDCVPEGNERTLLISENLYLLKEFPSTINFKESSFVYLNGQTGKEISLNFNQPICEQINPEITKSSLSVPLLFNVSLSINLVF